MLRIIFFILTITLTNAPVLAQLESSTLDGFPVNYVNQHPKEICGIYKQPSTNAYGNTEVVIILKEDGTCSTEWYNSLYTNKPKRNTTKCKWGLMVKENTDQPMIDDFDGAKWYQILLMSEDGKKLEYYDKPNYYDWVGVYPNGDVFLKLIFSTGEKIKKQ